MGGGERGIVYVWHVGPGAVRYWVNGIGRVGYGDLLAAYKGQWTDVDLTGTLEPPKDLFIDVRVLKDAGEIQTEYGYVFCIFSLVGWETFN